MRADSQQTSPGPGLTPESAAAQHRSLWSGAHEFRDASPDDFRQLDQRFYEQFRADVVAAGFRFVRNYVDVTASHSWPRNIAVLSVFLGDGGTIAAACYQVRLFGFVRVLQWIRVIPAKLRFAACDTELSDGNFVTTANDLEANKTSPYPFCDRLQLPARTPATEVIARHRQHLQDVLRQRPGVQPLRLQTYDDVRKSQDRQQLLKCELRNSPDFDRAKEWERVGGRPLTETERRFVEQVDAELHG